MELFHFYHCIPRAKAASALVFSYPQRIWHALTAMTDAEKVEVAAELNVQGLSALYLTEADFMRVSRDGAQGLFYAVIDRRNSKHC